MKYGPPFKVRSLVRVFVRVGLAKTWENRSGGKRVRALTPAGWATPAASSQPYEHAVFTGVFGSRESVHEPAAYLRDPRCLFHQRGDGSLPPGRRLSQHCGLQEAMWAGVPGESTEELRVFFLISSSIKILCQVFYKGSAVRVKWKVSTLGGEQTWKAKACAPIQATKWASATGTPASEGP